MKRTSLPALAALLAVVALPLSAHAQIAKPKKERPENEVQSKYEVYAGFAYSTLNQVNNSRSALGGAKVGVTRNWGRYFGLTAEGAYYKWAITATNPYPATVVTVLGGPVLHAELFPKVDAYLHGLLGVEHTGSTQQTPDYSFAGGIGGGLDYKILPRFWIRAYGDDIGASFSLTGNTAQLGYSPHRTWNTQAGIGVVYKF